MKGIVGAFIVIMSVVCFGFWCFLFISHGIQANNEFVGYWQIASRSSTIEKKSEYLDKYIAAIEKLKLNEGYSAIIFRKYNNYMPNNYDAIKSLQKRLHEVKGLDVKSFAYQTAIQQITGQEWDEADELVGEFEYKYYNEHSLYVRGAYDWISLFGFIYMFLIGGGLFVAEFSI